MTKSISLWPFFCFLASIWAPFAITVVAHHDFFEFPLFVIGTVFFVGAILTFALQPILQKLPRVFSGVVWFLFWFLLLNHFTLKISFFSHLPHLKKAVALVAFALAVFVLRAPKSSKRTSNIGLISLFISLGVAPHLMSSHLWKLESARQAGGGGGKEPTLVLLMDMFSVQQSEDGSQRVMSAARSLAEKHGLTLYNNHHAGYRVTVQSVPQIIGNKNEAWDLHDNLVPSVESIFARAKNEGRFVTLFGQRPIYCRLYSSFIDQCFAGSGEENHLRLRWARELIKAMKLYLTTLHPNLHALYSNKLSKDELLRLPESPLQQIDRFQFYLESSKKNRDHFVYFHTLFPHSPFVARQDCSVEESRQGRDKLLYFEKEQRERYIEQSLCAIKKLDEILEAVSRTTWGSSARILVISDHGREGRVENEAQPSHANIRGASHVYAWSRAPGQVQPHEVYELTSNARISEFLFGGFAELPRESSVKHTWFIHGKSQTLERREYISSDGMVWILKSN